MQSGRRNRAGAACGMAILVALAQSSPGNTEAPGASLASPLCPRAKAQKNPFDETSVTFDSVSEKRDERSTLVTYCVHVDAPKNKYLVDWPDTNMKDVFTDTDGDLQSSRVVSGDPSVTSSVVYFGANRTRFDVGAFKEATILGELNDFIVSRFRGAISTAATSRPEEERREKAQPVNLEVSVAKTGGAVTISAIDRSQEPRLTISLEMPPELFKANPDLTRSLRFDPKGSSAQYKVDSKSAVLHRVRWKTLERGQSGNRNDPARNRHE